MSFDPFSAFVLAMILGGFAFVFYRLFGMAQISAAARSGSSTFRAQGMVRVGSEGASSFPGVRLEAAPDSLTLVVPGFSYDEISYDRDELEYIGIRGDRLGRSMIFPTPDGEEIAFAPVLWAATVTGLENRGWVFLDLHDDGPTFL